jgi:hypothetical protein
VDRKWYVKDQMEAGRDDGRPVDNHKQKPVARHLEGGRKGHYSVSSDSGVGKRGGVVEEKEWN